MNSSALRKEALKARIALRRQYLEIQIQTRLRNGSRDHPPGLPPAKWGWVLLPPVAVLLWKRKINPTTLLSHSITAWRLYRQIIPLYEILESRRKKKEERGQNGSASSS